MDKIYYPQVFLEECIDAVKEKKMHKYIIDDIEIYSDDFEKSSDDSYKKTY